MPFRVSGRNIEIGESLRDRINGRVLETLNKYFDGGFSGHVTVGKEAYGFQTECVLHLNSGIVLRVEALAADAYVSADDAVVKLEKRLRRYHSRLKDRHGSNRGNDRAPDASMAIDAPSYVIATPDLEGDEEIAEFNPVIVAESTTALKHFSVSEAVMELDMTGASVVVFRHAGHGRVNLVYRRPDGNIGWIDPPALPNS
jgi:ribosomal subunit interface protein